MSDVETNPPVGGLSKNVESVGKMGSGNMDWKWAENIDPETKDKYQVFFKDKPKVATVGFNHHDMRKLLADEQQKEGNVLARLVPSEQLPPGNFLLIVGQKKSFGNDRYDVTVMRLVLDDKIHNGSLPTKDQGKNYVSYSEGSGDDVWVEVKNAHMVAYDEALNMGGIVLDEVVGATPSGFNPKKRETGETVVLPPSSLPTSENTRAIPEDILSRLDLD